MIQIVICDDIEKERKNLIHQLEKIELPEYAIIEYQNSKELMEAIDVFNQDCIFLLDIVMPNMTGVEVAKFINAKVKHASIIFITAYLNMVTDVYDTEHCYFILKSELEQRLAVAMSKSLQQIHNSRQSILITQGKEKIAIYQADIYYIERVKRYTYLHLEKTTLRVSENLDTLCCHLHPWFHQCHNSYIVNYSMVKSMQASSFLMRNSECVPISRKYAVQNKQEYHSYIIHSI